MVTTDDLKKSVVGNSAVTAVLGAKDRAVAGLREAPSRVKSLGSELPSSVKVIQAKAGTMPAALKESAEQLSGRASAVAAGVASLAFEVYDDLVTRGGVVVGRLRNNQLLPGRGPDGVAKGAATTIRRTQGTRRPTSKTTATESAAKSS